MLDIKLYYVVMSVLFMFKYTRTINVYVATRYCILVKHRHEAGYINNYTSGTSTSSIATVLVKQNGFGRGTH